MQDAPPFERFLDALGRGDEEASRLLVLRYTQTLLGIAHRALSPALRAKVDAEDVVQSVYRSFCGRLAGGSLALADWNHLWRLLRCITLRKCCAKADHYHAQRRDCRKETSLSDLSTAFAQAAAPSGLDELF